MDPTTSVVNLPLIINQCLNNNNNNNNSNNNFIIINFDNLYTASLKIIIILK